MILFQRGHIFGIHAVVILMFCKYEEEFSPGKVSWPSSRSRAEDRGYFVPERNRWTVQASDGKYDVGTCPSHTLLMPVDGTS